MPGTARRLLVALLTLGVATGLLVAGPASAAVRLTQVSADPYTDAEGQHATEVEPDTFSFGSNIVSAFQVGRRAGRGPASGSSNIGFATSTNGGATWTHGFLPGTTGKAGGPYTSISDPAVGYDAKHRTWLISTLGLDGPGGGAPVLTSRSTDGGRTWGDPVVTVAGATDKNWIACDNSETSRFYGNCYTQVGDFDATGGPYLVMTTSSDGGRTWSARQRTPDQATGSSGQPVVLPGGDVVVPYLAQGDTEMRSFHSSEGGASWSATVSVSSVNHHIVAGGLREFALPSAEVDAAGTVYLVWADCAWRSGCSRNDIVLSRSTSTTSWAAPVRVPIDQISGTADHFVPGVGVDPASFGRIGLTYYSYSDADCTQETCRLNTGFISSVNGGRTWSKPSTIAGPMLLTWLPDTWQGRMFGQYLSTSVLACGNAFPVFPVASAPIGGHFDVAMHAPTRGLPITGGRVPANGGTAQ